MIGVLGKPALARQDIVLGIGRTQRLGARWLRTPNPDGSNPQPMNLSGWAGTFRLTSSEGDVWLEKAMTTDAGSVPASGLVQVELAPSDTSGGEWQNRHTGRWAFIMVHAVSNETIVLAEGIARITQGVM